MRNLKKAVVGLSLGLSILLTGCGEDKRVEKDASGKIVSEAIYKDNQLWEGYKFVDYKLNWNDEEIFIKTKEIFKDGKSIGFDASLIAEFFKSEIDKNWKNVRNVPTKYVDTLLYALEKNVNAVHQMQKPVPDKVLETFLMKTGYIDTLKYIERPSESIMLFAVKKSLETIDYIKDKNPSEEVLRTYFNLYPNWRVLPSLKIKLPDDIQLKAVQASKDNFKYLISPSTEAHVFYLNH